MYIIKEFIGDEFKKINDIIRSYSIDQNSFINMTACSSYPFTEVLDIQAMPFNTLPTEGTIGKRYFPICKSLDDIELYSEELALYIFSLNKSDYRVSVQPNSGTQANQIVYNAILADGDTVLSLHPKDGGHISHTKMGCRNINVVYYLLDDKREIDYEHLELLIISKKPKLIIVGASSYTGEFNFARIASITSKYDVKIMSDICHSVLYIAGNVHNKIFPYVDFATFTLDKTLRGPQGGIIIYRSNFHNDISQSIFPKTQGGPLQNSIFAKAMCLIKLSTIDIQQYANTVLKNTDIILDILATQHIRTINKRARNHIILVDLSNTNYTGRDMEKIFYENKILVNRNQIPKDIRNALITSGIRLGTTTLTNLNYSSEDVEKIGQYIANIINYGNSATSIDHLISKYHSSINTSNLVIKQDIN